MRREPPALKRDEDVSPVATPPLAWGQHGDPIELPAEAAGWRVRRHKLGDRGGAPEVVYSHGRPLLLDLDTTVEELIERVGGKPGRYRLDAVDDAGKPVKAVPAFAVIDRGDLAAAPQEPGSDAVGRLLTSVEQLVRTQTEAMTSLSSQLASCLQAASGLLQPPDKRRTIEVVTAPAPPAPANGFDWESFLTSMAPALQGAVGLFMQKVMSAPAQPQIAAPDGATP